MNNFTNPFSVARAGHGITNLSRENHALHTGVFLVQSADINTIPVHIKDRQVFIFGYRLDLVPVLVEFIQHIQENSGFYMNAPVRKSEIRAAVAGVNSETRRALAQLDMPTDFSLIKPDGQKLIISRVSLDDIQKKITKLRAKNKATDDQAANPTENHPDIDWPKNLFMIF